MLRKIFIIPLDKNYNYKKAYELLNFVSTKKAEQIKKFYNSMDKKLSLYAQVAVKLIIYREYGIELDKIIIVENELGKPYILNFPNIHFNISHTHNCIAIGFSNRQVGVDVETVYAKNMGIAKRFFSFREYEYICVEAKNQDRAFFEIWTKKEAYVKCSGVGLRKPLNDFCVMSDSLIDKFITFNYDNYVISFYDGLCNNDLSIIKLTEKEIENLKLSY